MRAIGAVAQTKEATTSRLGAKSEAPVILSRAGVLPAWRIRSISPLTVSPGRANGGLSDIEACGGVHREADVKTCPDCNGDGVIEKGTDDEQQCPTCGGSGFVPDDDDDEEVIRTASRMPTNLRQHAGSGRL